MEHTNLLVLHVITRLLRKIWSF